MSRPVLSFALVLLVSLAKAQIAPPTLDLEQKFNGLISNENFTVGLTLRENLQYPPQYILAGIEFPARYTPPALLQLLDLSTSPGAHWYPFWGLLEADVPIQISLYLSSTVQVSLGLTLLNNRLYQGRYNFLPWASGKLSLEYSPNDSFSVSEGIELTHPALVTQPSDPSKPDDPLTSIWTSNSLPWNVFIGTSYGIYEGYAISLILKAGSYCKDASTLCSSLNLQVSISPATIISGEADNGPRPPTGSPPTGEKIYACWGNGNGRIVIDYGTSGSTAEVKTVQSRPVSYPKLELQPTSLNGSRIYLSDTPQGRYRWELSSYYSLFTFDSRNDKSQNFSYTLTQVAT